MTKTMEGKNESKHTPKWRWILNESSKTVRLESTESGRDTIMDFVRYGMTWAQPRFNVDGIMIKAEELGETVEGREHHSEWFKFINHPTAKLIASAPALLEENENLKWKCSIWEPKINELSEEVDVWRKKADAEEIDAKKWYKKYNEMSAIAFDLRAEVDRLKMVIEKMKSENK